MFFINFRLLTRDPKYQMLKSWNGSNLGSWVPGFRSHSAVFTASLGGDPPDHPGKKLPRGQSTH